MITPSSNFQIKSLKGTKFIIHSGKGFILGEGFGAWSIIDQSWVMMGQIDTLEGKADYPYSLMRKKDMVLALEQGLNSGYKTVKSV